MDDIPQPHNLNNPREKLINELIDKRKVYQELEVKSEDENIQIIIKRILSNIDTTIIYIENSNTKDVEEISRKIIRRDI